MLGFLYMAVEHFHHIVLCGYVLCHLGIYHLALSIAVIEGLLHDTAAHGGHLRTVLGVDDGGHDIAAECRTNLVEQVVIVYALLLVVVVAYLKLRAVCGKTARER